MPSTLKLECATCGESAAVLNPGARSIEALACPACNARGTLREPVETLGLGFDVLEPLATDASALVRPRRSSGFAFLVRLAIVVVLGGLLAHWFWERIGPPRIEVHTEEDGSVKEIRVVPTTQ